MAETDEPVNIYALTDLRTPWCVHVVVTLRVAEQIDAGVTSIDALARAVSCDPDCLHRVLTHLVGKGVFEEPKTGQFVLNSAARQLLDPATRIGLDLDGIGGRMAYAWGTLPTYVRTGKPGYDQIFGLPFWEDLEANPNIAASFDALIGSVGHGTPNPDFQLAGGWESVRTVVDVGGGTGSMLAEILRAHPEIRGTLIELPRTVARSTDVFEAAGVADRVTTVGQSFFDPLPAGADLYLLRGVLNDLPDREATELLRRCADAARPNGRLVILKSMSPDETSKELGIEMVLLGGKRRTVAEFQKLAAETGLEVLTSCLQPNGEFGVECRPI